MALRRLPGIGHSTSIRWHGIILAVSSLLAIAAGEVVTAFTNHGAGLTVHLVLVAVFLTLAAILEDYRSRTFFLILALAPLTRVIALGLPLGGIPQPFWLPLTAIPFLGAVLAIANLLDLSPSCIGLQLAQPEAMPLECAVAVSGIGLGLMEWYILRPTPLAVWGSIPLLLLVAALLLICTGLLECLLFQGFIQHAAGDLLGSIGAILFTAGAFALLHTAWRSPSDLAFMFGVGVYFGVVRRLTGSVLGISLGHGIAAIMVFVVLPLRLTSPAASAPNAAGSPGLLAALALIVLLAAREIAGASTRERIRRWRASLTIAVVPLLLIFAVIAAEKVSQVV